MKKIVLLVLLALVSVVGSAEAGTGGSQENSKTRLVGVNVPTYASSFRTCPTESMFDYYRTKNWMLLRMPISGTILQPVKMGGFDSSYQTCLDNVATWAEERDIQLIWDFHGGETTFNNAEFVDFWTKFADRYGEYSSTKGYDLQNEPYGNEYDGNPKVWFDRAQAAITGIRTVDTSNYIYLESVHWSSAWLWRKWAGYALQVTDPQNKIIYSAHAYADRDGSGTHSNWLEEVAAGDQLDPKNRTLDTNILVKRYTPFVTWCKKNNKQCHIGESGVGYDHPDWLTTLDKGLNYLTKNNVEFTYWAAGSIWGDTYPYSIEPKASGQDRPQAAVLSKYTGNYHQPKAFITGPQRGSEDTPSSQFTVSYNGWIRKGFSITPTTQGSGTFSPSSITCVAGFNCEGTFTYTANNSDISVISTDSNGAASPADNFGYATITDGFSNGNFTPVNAYSLRKIYGPYLGPAVRLRRGLDNQEKDFYFASSQLGAEVNQNEINRFANHSDLYVVKWYDQGPGQRHAVPSFVDRTPSLADQPKLILDCVNGKPCVRFNGANAMEATSAIHNKTGQTLMWVYKPTNHLENPMLSWQFINGQHKIYSNASKDRYQVRPYSGSSPTPIIVDLRTYSDSGSWSANAASWTKNATDGAVTYKNGIVTNKKDTGEYTLVYPMRTNLQLGFTYIGGTYFNYFSGDVAELVVYDSNLTNNQVLYFQNEQVTQYGLNDLSDFVWPTPTLEQNIGAANAMPWRGINQGGLGFGTNFNSLPRTEAQPYYTSRGFNITRFPVHWEVIQPNLCSGDTTLDATQMGYLDTAINTVTASGMDIILDLHNYGSYNYNYGGRVCTTPSGSNNIVDDTATKNYFVNVWGQLAARYKDNPKVKFDLMNEPVGRAANLQAPIWQEAITAIRTAGANQHIMVEWGPGWGACMDFHTNGGPSFLTLTDPQNKLIAHCHNYLRTGTAVDSYCADCDDTATEGKGLGIVTNATAYAKANNIKLFLGEFGLGHTASAYSEGKKMLDYIAANMDSGSGGWVGWTAWGGGRDWGEDYMIKFEPLSFNTPVADKPNMQFLSTYATGGTWPSASGSWPNDVKFP